jgi:hypothetical protein
MAPLTPEEIDRMRDFLTKKYGEEKISHEGYASLR